MTRVVAKPQLRGAEGTKISLNLGSEIPVVSTSYTPIATGGAGVNPLSSYQYRDVGVNIEMTPTVTLEGDIRLDLTLDDSQLGDDKSIAGTTVPTFVQRKVTTRLPEDLPPVLVDGLLIEQVLINLLENATKHTPAGQPIDIEARRVADTIVVDVADRGPGLPTGEEHRIFDKFFGAGTGGGAGLGLTICRAIVEAHGGRIRGENRPGGGAVFRFSLPAGEPPRPPEGGGD